MMLIKLILEFAKIGLMSFGGGYAAIPIVEQEIVHVCGWMSSEQFSTVVAIDELTPGPVAINCATFVGNHMAGTIGGICATLGYIFPSIVIAIILVKIYAKYNGLDLLNGALKGLKCMVVALIASTSISILISAIYVSNKIDYISIVLFLIGLFLFRKYKVHPLFVILGSGLVTLLLKMIGI